MGGSGALLKLILLSGLVPPMVVGRYHPTSVNRGSCHKGSCQTPTGNLLIGRADRLRASSTCGLYGEERFCKVSHLEEEAKCFRCDSRPGAPIELSHRIENIIYRHHTAPGYRNRLSWWQSENGKENVTIQLDLEAEFHFTHLIMKFRTFRPASMLVERSSDFGKTWKVYRYFADNCAASFPHVRLLKPDRDRPFEPYCDSTYSGSTPVTDGEVILRVLTPSFQAKYDPYSEELQDLMKMTNLRIHLTKLHTLGDDLLDSRKEIQEKYYYAIHEMNVRGSCWCYGHAAECLPLNDSIKDVPDMVHGRCDCSHNTTGTNCKKCKDTHNDFPWKPATGLHTNACKKCNCNDHAETCKFNEELFEKSGRTTGSECINCEHNTAGNNCELCIPGFYHDPRKSISDVYSCLECKCYEEGTIDGGLCDAPATGEAPKCHCKSKVTGDSCDQCLPGYWNLDPLNPDGCQACSCNLSGTTSDTCDQDHGTCYCKPNVIGKDCDQCAPEHWGLSADSYGCKPCNCDLGGSIDNQCDVVTGQCRCFNHIGGRTCDKPEQGFFVQDLDLIYEAEDALCMGACIVDIQEWPKDRTPSWTGKGFMRVYDTSRLEFNIDNIPKSMDYYLIIRYDKVPKHETVEATATIERIDGLDDACSNASPTEIYKYQLQPGKLYSTADDYTPLCLEEGKRYKVVLTFKSDYNQVEATPASILIDSIVLIPNPSIEFLKLAPGNDSTKEEYDRLNCKEIFYSPLRIAVPEICKHYHYSISVYINEGAKECKCNPKGSLSQFCEPAGGKCECRNKVVGRTCNKCAEGTYGFDFPDGCVDCDCNGIGAEDNICDASNGQCRCNNGIYGRTCDQCQPGSWGFPNCQPCQCHGYAHTCDSKTGECIDCRDHTTGYSCDKCDRGYYGDPIVGLHCRPCKCPDTEESGHSFASGCILMNEDVRCLCKDGYAGVRCDKCDNNFYGSPEKDGGSCQQCNCSGNVDTSQPGACDTQTGKCLLCLYDTTGFNCESCRPGFFGDALQHNCTACMCDPLGHDRDQGECNAITGECPCKPNVVGRKCDNCKPGTKLIATGEGCQACDCDLIGSLSPICNEYTGDCECRSGFGGHHCNECQSNFWGDPNTECYPCECSMEGSVNGTCHQANGSCICKEGIGGEKCDICARGYYGAAPNCVKCVECFDNWDKIIKDLSEKTDQVIQSASEIRRTGTSGYGDKFDGLIKKIDDVNTTLTNTDSNKKLLDVLNKDVEAIRGRLSNSVEKVTMLTSGVENVLSRLSLANIYLNTTYDEASQLKIRAQELTSNATNLQEKDLKGALNLTREAGDDSRVVSKIENEILPKLLQEAEKKCKGTEKLIYRDNETFIQTEQQHDAKRGNLEFLLAGLENQIPNLNKHICDGSGESCDPVCGGAGCGHCGGRSISCENGAVGKVEAGLNLADLYASQISTKLRKAELQNREMSNAKQKTEETNEAARDAYKVASVLKSKFEDIVDKLSIMNKNLSEFISGDRASPNEIITVVNETLSLNMKLDPEKIESLAKQINSTNDSLTNVTAILDDTKHDRDAADKLKNESDEAKKKAESVLEKAQKVVEGLNAAKRAQDKAQEEIETANGDIDEINKLLSQVVSETTDADSKVNNTKLEIENIKTLLKALQTTVLQNKHGADQVKKEADDISNQVNNTYTKADDLKGQYNKVKQQISSRETVSDKSKSRAEELLKAARHLSVRTKTKQNELQEVNGAYNKQESKLNELEDKIDQLTAMIQEDIDYIEDKDKIYRSCES